MKMVFFACISLPPSLLSLTYNGIMSSLVELEGNFAAYLSHLHSLLDPGNLPVGLSIRNNATESIYSGSKNCPNVWLFCKD